MADKLANTDSTFVIRSPEGESVQIAAIVGESSLEMGKQIWLSFEVHFMICNLQSEFGCVLFWLIWAS